jgi:hypothetical protein
MTPLRKDDRVTLRKSPGKLGTVLAIEPDGTNAVVRWDDHPVARAESCERLVKASEPPNDLQ